VNDVPEISRSSALNVLTVPVALAGTAKSWVTADAASSPANGGERLRVLLRDVYAAAGGSHSDLAAYDRAMAVERRTVVLLTPDRFATHPPGAEHVEHQQAEGGPSDACAPEEEIHR